MKVKISAVIITYNEERNIHRCLESLVSIADEIVVVDSYSTDRTEEICSAFNVRFIRHRFTGHIEQKNWAILQASSPFILSLDADEALSDELRSSIMKVKENWTHDGYYFNRLTSYCEKWIRHTSWYPARKLRLWDSRKGSWGGFNPHDRFFLTKGSTRKFLKGDILHYSYYTVSEHIAQMNSFSTIMARSYYDRGRHVYISSIVLHPLWRFIKDFFLRTGFMDGYYGFIVSVNSAHEVFLKYVKLKNIYKDEKRRQKQTICLFNSQRSWGGGEKWHVDVASHLVRKGYKVLFISSPDSPLARKMQEIGVSGYQIRVSNLSFLNPFKVIKLAGIFRREKVVSLVTNLSGDMKVASNAARFAGVPKIVYRRGSAIPIRNTPINRYLLRRVVTRIIANSEEVKRTILVNNSNLVPEDKISIVYNGVSLARYNSDAAPLYHAQDKEIVLGCAGRLSEEKGHEHLLELMKILSNSSYRFKMLIAGEGRLLNMLQKKASKLEVEERVEFLGFIKDMPAFFNSIDVFLLTSSYEGFSNAVLEAMASAKPVISFDVRSTREVIDHGVTGYVGKENSVEEMASWILELAADESRRKEMGLKGRERIEASFSFEKCLEEIITLLTRSNGF